MKAIKPLTGQLTLFDMIVPVNTSTVAEVKKPIPEPVVDNPELATALKKARVTKPKLSPVQKFIKDNNGRVIEDDITVTSKDFKSYCRSLKTALNKEAKEKGFDYVTLCPSHYDYSGFFKFGERYVYYSSSVERYDKPTYLDREDNFGSGRVLYRTARSEKDFTGGHNNYCHLGELIDNALRLCKE